jgi:hypothetical protein
MRKSDKKVENLLRITLTAVCDNTLKEETGFQWITHFVNYDDFYNSLKIVCVFDTNENLSQFTATGSNVDLTALIQTKLIEAGIILKGKTANITYDTEENREK